jgi:hypothetical protein
MKWHHARGTGSGSLNSWRSNNAVASSSVSLAVVAAALSITAVGSGCRRDPCTLQVTLCCQRRISWREAAPAPSQVPRLAVVDFHHSGTF